MRKTNKLMAMILTCVMAFSVLFGAQNVSAAEFSGTKAEVEALLKECYDNNPVKETFVYGYEWQIMNYARCGVVTEEQKQSYFHSVAAYLREKNLTCFPSVGENAKVALALYAMNCDPKNVEGYNLIEPCLDASKATVSVYTLSPVMLAVYNAGETEKLAEYKDAMARFYDTEAGAWGYVSGGRAWADKDGTAMAIQALAPFYGKDAEVKEAVDRGIAYLVADLDTETGAVTSWGSANACTTAYGVIGITACGMNPVKDETLCKDGKNLISGLQTFYCGKGRYKCYTTEGTQPDDISSEQCTMAMIAYNRLINGQTAFFDFSDLRQPAVYKYPVLEGASQTVDTTKDGTLSIRIDCPMEKFVGVEMDGVMVDPKYYTVKSGSTIVTFTSEYVKTLKAGAHAVTVNFTDGSATVNVEVKDASSAVTTQTVKSPKTGDKFPVAVIAVLLLTLGSAACIKKRSEKK